MLTFWQYCEAITFTQFIHGGSKPIRAYHGTDTNFQQFITKPGFPRGFAFTTNLEAAKRYAKRMGNNKEDKQVIVADLAISNPFQVPSNKDIEEYQGRISELEAQGYDAIVKIKKYNSGDLGIEYQVFRPQQIDIVHRVMLDEFAL